MSRRGEPEEVVEFDDILCERETENALLVSIDGTDYWIPKSQLSPESEVTKEDDRGMLVVTKWIATQKGLV